MLGILQYHRILGYADASTLTPAVLVVFQTVLSSLSDGQGKANSKGANTARVPFPLDPSAPRGLCPRLQ